MEFSFPSDIHSTKGIKETRSKSYRKRFKQEKKCITNKWSSHFPLTHTRPRELKKPYQNHIENDLNKKKNV